MAILLSGWSNIQGSLPPVICNYTCKARLMLDMRPGVVSAMANIVARNPAIK